MHGLDQLNLAGEHPFAVLIGHDLMGKLATGFLEHWEKQVAHLRDVKFLLVDGEHTNHALKVVDSVASLDDACHRVGGHRVKQNLWVFFVATKGLRDIFDATADDASENLVREQAANLTVADVVILANVMEEDCRDDFFPMNKVREGEREQSNRDLMVEFRGNLIAPGADVMGGREFHRDERVEIAVADEKLANREDFFGKLGHKERIS
jgi:hypothetical protein